MKITIEGQIGCGSHNIAALIVKALSNLDKNITFISDRSSLNLEDLNELGDPEDIKKFSSKDITVEVKQLGRINMDVTKQNT